MLPVQILIFPAALVAANGDGEAQSLQRRTLLETIRGHPVGTGVSAAKISFAGQSDRAEQVGGVSRQAHIHSILAELVRAVAEGEHARFGLFVCGALARKHGNGEVAAELTPAAGQQLFQLAGCLLCFVRGEDIVLTTGGKLIKFPRASIQSLVKDVIVSR